jgi:hypothetical protein
VATTDAQDFWWGCSPVEPPRFELVEQRRADHLRAAGVVNACKRTVGRCATQKSQIDCRDILRKVFRRCVELALIVAIATLQCVWWTNVDDARQPTRDGRAFAASTGAHGGVGAARVRATASVIPSGVVTHIFVPSPPAVSCIKSRAEAAVRICDSLVEIPLAPRPPPTLE